MNRLKEKEKNHPIVSLSPKLQMLGPTMKIKRIARENASTSLLLLKGAQRDNLSSKGTMKRNIVEMMVVHTNNGSMSTKTPYRPMLGFQDSEKVEGIPNEIFVLVITATIRHFDIS